MRVLGSEAAALTRERRPFLLQHLLVSADEGEQGSPGQKTRSVEDSCTIAAYKRMQGQVVPKISTQKTRVENKKKTLGLI